MKFKHNYKVELAKTLTGHWYSVWEEDKFLGHFPSSTTILNAYPQSQHLTKWIAEQGWQESQRIKTEAGLKGTNIHSACDYLEEGAELNEASYSTEEWYKVTAFYKWYEVTLPKLIAKELPVFSKKGKFAGRADRIYEINGEYILLDFKSSSAIHPHFPLQFASYAQAIEENIDIKITATAALQLGALNKNTYRYEVYPDWKKHYKVFKHVKATWDYDYFGSKKKKKELPILDLPQTLSLRELLPKPS